MTNNPPKRRSVNKIEKRVTFQIKAEYYLQLVMPEMMKLLRSNENIVTKDRNGENVSLSKVTRVMMVHYNILNSYYQHDSTVLYAFVFNK